MLFSATGAMAKPVCRYVSSKPGAMTKDCPKDVAAYIERFRVCYSGNDLSPAQESKLNCDVVLCDGAALYKKYKKQPSVVAAVNDALAADADAIEWQKPTHCDASAR